MLIASAGLFGIFLFLTYYLQQTLGYSPLVTGVAFLPISAGLILAAANLSTIVLMPRTGPRPLVALGMLAAAGGAAWLAQLGPHTAYAAGVLEPIILAGIGVGLVIAPVINTGTFGVAPQEAGVAYASTYWPEFAAAGKERVDGPPRHGPRRRPAPGGRAPRARDLADWDRCTLPARGAGAVVGAGHGHGYHALTQGYLIGEIVRRITGDTIGAWFAREVAKPLGRRLPHRAARQRGRTGSPW